jgi:hypothetical protein
MTPLTPSRVPLLLETTKVTKPACSVAKIRGRTVFCRGEVPDWAFWKNSIDRLRAKFDRSTFEFDRSTLRDFRISKHFLMKFAIPLLLTYKTQKLTKTSENNKAKGLTNVNQGVQIHNFWYLSVCIRSDDRTTPFKHSA